MIYGQYKMFIREWNASFYDEGGAPGPDSSAKKEWKYGVLKLFLGRILFSQDKKELKGSTQAAKHYPLELELKFFSIESFKRANSSLLFPAILIFTTKKEKLWFSSFNNRDETFLYLEYFFHFLNTKERPVLIRQNDAAFGAESTNIGKEMLKSVVDSNKSLANAGESLVEQGQQIRNASVKVCEMNQNLDVASRFTNGLKSWFPRWRIPKAYHQESFHVLNKDDVLDIHSFTGLYRDITPNIKSCYLRCIVTTEKRGISIMDDYQKLIKHFNWTAVSRVQVVAAWEICITQYLIGEHDRKCSLVSIQVPQLLKQIEKYRPDRTEPISPEVKSAWSMFEQMRDGHYTLKGSESLQGRLDEEDDFYNYYNAHNKQPGVPSNQEVSDLSKELTSLKSLALDVQKVQDEQVKDIEELTAAVTRETDHLSSLNKTMKRML